MPGEFRDFRARPPALDPRHVSQIKPERQQAKEGAEDILALRYPGDRFDVHGMQGEESSDEPAAPNCAGHRTKQSKQQQAIGGVKQKIGEMMSRGTRSE